METLGKEFGHVFALCHVFAQPSETQWPSVVIGRHCAFSIMNDGSRSRLAASDRSDPKKLCAAVWAGPLTGINGTPIEPVKPFHLS